MLWASFSLIVFIFFRVDALWIENLGFCLYELGLCHIEYTLFNSLFDKILIICLNSLLRDNYRQFQLLF